MTPDEANRDPSSGGLVVHKAHAPSDWAFRTYNADSARMAQFLEEAGDEPVETVPYRRNRVVIFDSDLFHRTDDLDFRPGYENRAHQRHDALRQSRRALEFVRSRTNMGFGEYA